MKWLIAMLSCACASPHHASETAAPDAAPGTTIPPAQMLAPGANPVPLPDACAAPTVSCTAADATSCLQTAITHQTSIVLPAQTFTISTGLHVPANAQLVGCGATLTLANPGVMLSIEGTGITVDSLNLVYTAGVKNNGMINIAAGTTNLAIQNSTFSGYDVAAIQFNAIDIGNVKISNNTILDGNFGILVNTTAWKAADLPILAHHPHDIAIDHNTFRDIRADAIEVNSAVLVFAPHNSGIPGVAAHAIQITNNDISSSLSDSSGAGFCVGLAGTFDVEVSGNSIHDCKWQLIHMEDTANAIDIHDNTMAHVIGPQPTDTSSWAAADSSGVIMLNVNHIQIHDNAIRDVVGAGIEQTWTATSFDSDIAVANNVVETAGADCFFVGGPGGKDLATTIGPGNTALGCTGMAAHIAGTPLGVTVANNVNF